MGSQVLEGKNQRLNHPNFSFHMMHTFINPNRIPIGIPIFPAKKGKLPVGTMCGKAFSQKARCTVHQTLHTGEKPYTCEVCGRGYTQKSQFEIHQGVHTGEKSCTCDICGKAFSVNLSLSENLH